METKATSKPSPDKGKSEAVKEASGRPEGEPTPSGKAPQEPRAGADDKGAKRVVLGGNGDALYDDLKVVKVENLALHNLAADLEDVDIEDLLRECISLAQAMFPGAYYEPVSPAIGAVEDNQEPILGAKEDPQAQEASDDGQKLQAAEEKLREAEDLLQKGMVEEAQRSYEEALQLNPGHEAARKKLDDLLEAQRRLAEAESKIRQQYPSLLDHGRGLLAAIQDQNEAKALVPALEGTPRVLEVASDTQAAVDRLPEQMLEVAFKSMGGIDAAKSITAAIATCDEVIALLDVARELDASNPKVAGAIATARDRRNTLVEAQEPLDRAERLVGENSYDSLSEAGQLLSLAHSRFPDEPKTRLLLGKVRERYLERAEEAAADGDWKAAQCWLAETNKGIFASLPSDQRGDAIGKRIKKLQKRGWILRGAAAAAVLLGAAFGGTFLWSNSAEIMKNELFKQAASIPALNRVSEAPEPALSPSVPRSASEAPEPALSPSVPRSASEASPLSPVAMNPSPGCAYDSKYGHNVCDDREVAFKSFWEKHKLALGAPITEKRVQNGSTVQYFENGRLEFHPQNPERYLIELSLLGYLGDPSLRGYDQFFLPQEEGKPDKMAEGSRFYDATRHYLGNSHLFRDFWEANGGLEIFGNPISEEFLPKETGRYRQYFERAIFEYYEESQPPGVRLLPLGLKYAQASGWVR